MSRVHQGKHPRECINTSTLRDSLQIYLYPLRKNQPTSFEHQESDLQYHFPENGMPRSGLMWVTI